VEEELLVQLDRLIQVAARGAVTTGFGAAAPEARGGTDAASAASSAYSAASYSTTLAGDADEEDTAALILDGVREECGDRMEGRTPMTARIDTLHGTRGTATRRSSVSARAVEFAVRPLTPIYALAAAHA
jgi:hypothetical protein